MRVTIICGFLGSGKTTLLKQLLANATSRTVVLVNEYGELGLDGDLIKQSTDMDVIEMRNGCVCCVLRNDLLNAIQEITKTLKPEQLLIELSGVATVSGVLEALAYPQVRHLTEDKAVIGIIDVSTFAEFSDFFGSFFNDQIKHSDLILLNKSDLAGAEEVSRVYDEIKELNPVALLNVTEHCRIDPAILSGEFKSEEDSLLHSHGHGVDSPRFEVVSWIPKNTVEFSRLEEMLHAVADGSYGKIFRSKGVVSTTEGRKLFETAGGDPIVKEIGRASCRERV